MVNYYVKIMFSYESLDIYNKNRKEKLTIHDLDKLFKMDKIVMLVITIIINNIDLLQKSIVILIFAVPIVFRFLEFNVLTIVYTILTLTFWYALFSIVEDFPTNKADITITNNEKIKDVYIIENNPGGHILVLNKDNKTIQIMKGSIIKIEYKKP
jgi:hypothetical protein